MVEQEAPPPLPSMRSSVHTHHPETTEHLKALLYSNIPEDDIWDKSKGDAFTKGFALLQTGWFLIQTLARLMSGIGITHLEVTTLAYATLNGVVYWFWWNKPLDIQCPIVIDLDGRLIKDSGESREPVHSGVLEPPSPVYTPSGRSKDSQYRTNPVNSTPRFQARATLDQIPLRNRAFHAWRSVRRKSSQLMQGQSLKLSPVIATHFVI